MTETNTGTAPEKRPRELTSKQRKWLRGEAHHVDPLVRVGQGGLSAAIAQAASEALDTHELIKVKVLEGSPVTHKEAGAYLADACGAHLVGTIGHIAILYRRHPKKPLIPLPESMNSLPEAARALITERASEPGPVLWLTGAGISAESGIPTFRGEEGYWKVGSTHYRPQELATFAAFTAMADEVWAWYLFRRGVCRSAEPNAAHRALVTLEDAIGDRFQLITQNVDGLHQRAGSERVFAIHGNIDQMRPVGGARCVAIPEGVPTEWPRGRALSAAERALLQVDGQPARPHVLWFDECYDEERFRFESSLSAAASASLLIVVGTTGATNLPMQIGRLCARKGTPSIVVNPEPNPFSEMVEHTGAGLFLEGTAGAWVPPLADALAEAYGRD